MTNNCFVHLDEKVNNGKFLHSPAQVEFMLFCDISPFFTPNQNIFSIVVQS